MKLDKETIRKLKIYKKAKKAQRALTHGMRLTKQQRDSLKLSIAKAMITFPTPAESAARPILQKMGFVQQYKVCGYIADFANEEKKVIIELDGAVHLKQREYDEYRDKVLSDHGWLVVRCPNGIVRKDRDAFIGLVRKACV